MWFFDLCGRCATPRTRLPTSRSCERLLPEAQDSQTEYCCKNATCTGPLPAACQYGEVLSAVFAGTLLSHDDSDECAALFGLSSQAYPRASSIPINEFDACSFQCAADR